MTVGARVFSDLSFGKGGDADMCPAARGQVSACV